ncbi:hypothetical protein Fcan01_13558 [Folsomia candida]|uniref:Uncharacterized protein n=1 Tax=Folsomia candida TaxID=158441 RepID=A0A226E1L9_FOLCA|nr:hypothetical protein Fcan01_13558 [Folsomia candida]
MSSIILISASMDYDQSWNDWVDERFNLNHKNAQFKRRMTDYADVESQQDWINMLSRDLFLDEMYLLITLAALIITVFHTLSRVNNNLIGGVVYTLCSGLLLVANTFLIISVINQDSAEDGVEKILDNVLDKRNSSGSPQAFAAAAEVGTSMKKDLSCRSENHNQAILRHCQLLAVKILGIVTAFIQAGISSLLAIYYICCKPIIIPESPAERQARLSQFTGQNQPIRYSWDPNPNLLLATKQQKLSLAASAQRESIRSGDISLLKDEYRRTLRQDGPNFGAYQPHVRGPYDGI